MRQQSFTKPDRYIRCPVCGQDEKMVSHLDPGTSFGPWYCDECGSAFIGRVVDGTTVEVEVTGERCDKTLVTLRLERKDAPVTLLVEGMRFTGGNHAPDDDSHDAFYYDEHTCPTNYFPHVVRIIAADGDEDPHGIFRYVKTKPWRDVDEVITEVEP